MIWIILAIAYFVVALVISILLLLSESEMTIEYGEPIDYFDDLESYSTFKKQVD
jgi:hypothetical protein